MKMKHLFTLFPYTGRFICLLLSACGLGMPAASAILYDFNTPGQLEDNFYGNFGTQVSSGGLSNTGRVDNTYSSARAFEITKQTFSAQVTEEISMSIYFQFGGTSGPIFSGETLWLGIGRDSNPDNVFEPVGGNSGLQLGPKTLQSLQVGIGPRTSENLVRIYYASVVDGVNTNYNAPGNPTVELTVGNWYYLEVTYTLLAEKDGYSFEVGLFNSTADGIVTGNALLSYSSSITNSNLAAGELHAFFGGRYAPSAGAVAVDNFYVSAIPEASEYALILGILSIGLILRRYRNQI